MTKLDELLTPDHREMAMGINQLGGEIHVIYNINSYDISVYTDPEKQSTIQEAVPPKKI